VTARYFTSVFCLFLLTAALSITGCSSGSGLVLVEGTVTLDGEPLPQAEVVFRPDNGRPSVGLTDAEGKYKLKYTAERMGAVIGPHVVSIRTSLEDPDGEKVSPKERVPPQYNSRSTLKVELTAKQSEPINFDLVTKP